MFQIRDLRSTTDTCNIMNFKKHTFLSFDWLAFLVFLALQKFGKCDNSSETYLKSCFNFSTVHEYYSKVIPGNKIVIKDFFIINQDFLSMAIKKYPRVRDFYNEPPYFGPTVHQSFIVSEKMNATLIMKANLKKHCRDSFDNPLFPTISISNMGSSLIKKFERWPPGTLRSNPDRPRVILPLTMALNFAYCNALREAVIGNSPFSIFHNTADYLVWISLTTSFFLVTVLVHTLTRFQGSLGDHFLVMLSALLCPGVSMVTQLLQYCWLFTVWTCICLIFVTYYSGSMTSVVISPTPEWRMTHIGEVVERNYSLINSNPTGLHFIRQMVSLNLPPPHVASNISDKFLEADKLLKMLQKAYAPSPSNKFFQMMASPEKYATVTSWTDAIFAATRSINYISQQQIKSRKCYLGKELSYAQNFYHVFTPPENNRLADLFQKTMEGGLYDYWYGETVGVGQSERVQGRTRVLSRTSLVEETEPIHPLEIEGKLKNVFLFWLVCSAISTATWTMEVMWFQYTKSHIVTGMNMDVSFKF